MRSQRRIAVGRAVIAAACASLLTVSWGWAGDWPGWRGPTGTGATLEKDLPLTWGGKANENVLWQVKIGERSYSSPIVWGDRVFITDADRQSDQDVKNKVIPEHRVICDR